MKQHTTRPELTRRDGPLFPKLPQTTSLDIYYLRATPPESRLSIAALTGLVNRGSARIYLVENGDDEFWLNEIDPTLPLSKPSIEDHDPFEHLLTAYREHIQGLVIYDLALPDTVNIASTLAGLCSGLVVSPAQAERLRGEPYHLPVLADLRTHGWRTPLQAYAWAYQHVLPQCSRELVAGLDPGICGHLRAFLVTHRVFTCWLDARKIVPSLSSDWLSERRLLKRVFASFPPGSLHLGWFVSEPFGIRLASRAALLTFASDHCTNLEVWSNLRSTSEAVSALDRPLPKKKPAEQSSAGTTYLSFTISDGDNLQYCQHYLLRLWNDRARGSLPLGWTIAPALQQVMPDLAAFYRRTATTNDEFIAGPSGAGYILPSHWPRAHHETFLRLTAEYMRAMQLSTLQVLDSRSLLSWFSMKFLNPSLQNLFAARLSEHGLSGILSGAGGFRPSWHYRSAVPIYQNLGLALNKQRALRLIQSAARRGTRFINIYIFAWQITPGDLQEIVNQLGDGFTVVTPGRLLELIEQEH